MTPRPLAALGLLLLCLAAGAQALAQDPTPPPGRPRRPAYQAPARPSTASATPASTCPTRRSSAASTTGVFRVGEFRERWFASYLLDRPRTDSAGRHEFLNSMVNKEVLAALAREVEPAAGVRGPRRPARDPAAPALQRHLRPPGDRLRALHERRGAAPLRAGRATGSTCSASSRPTRPTAERARADVVAKRLTWAEAVKKYSTGRGDKGPDGDLGWVERDRASSRRPRWRSSTCPTAASRRSSATAAAGSSCASSERRPEPAAALPARSPRCWPRRSCPSSWPSAPRQLRGLIRAAHRHGLRQHEHRLGRRACSPRPSAQTQGDGPTSRSSTSAAPSPSSSRPTPRACWPAGGTARFTLGDFLAVYNATPGACSGTRSASFTAFRSTLDRFVLEPYMARAGPRARPRPRLDRRRRAWRRRRSRSGSSTCSATRSRPGSGSRARSGAKYYEDHLPDFFGLQSVTYAAIVRHSKAGADSVVARLQGRRDAPPPSCGPTRWRASTSGSIRTEGRAGRRRVPQARVRGAARGRHRASLGPDQQGDYLVLQKLVHDPGHQLPFEEVQGLVDESVQNLKAEQLLKEFIARHRAKHDVELHPELLMRIRLAGPARLDR